MGVTAASNTFNVLNTGRLLLKVAKKSIVSCIASADTKTMNKPWCVYSAEFANSLIIMAAAGFYTGSRPSQILQNDLLRI